MMLSQHLKQTEGATPPKKEASAPSQSSAFLSAGSGLANQIDLSKQEGTPSLHAKQTAAVSLSQQSVTKAALSAVAYTSTGATGQQAGSSSQEDFTARFCDWPQQPWNQHTPKVRSNRLIFCQQAAHRPGNTALSPLASADSVRGCRPPQALGTASLPQALLGWQCLNLSSQSGLPR